MITIAEASRMKGVSRDTVRNYIKDGRIEATLVPDEAGRLAYVLDESELEKLPKPYKKHGTPRGSEVPQGPNPTQVKVRVKERETIFEGNEEQAKEFYRTFQHVAA